MYTIIDTIDGEIFSISKVFLIIHYIYIGIKGLKIKEFLFCLFLKICGLNWKIIDSLNFVYCLCLDFLKCYVYIFMYLTINRVKLLVFLN